MKAGLLQGIAVAPPNIALIKYWGKADSYFNLPESPSLSVTLAKLVTRTRVVFSKAYEQDIVILNDRLLTGSTREAAGDPQWVKVHKFLSLVRELADCHLKAFVDTFNNFPTGAGLASSASGFAALALAATQALKLDLSRRQLSALARRGSGSAARSLFGGFVEMVFRGEKEEQEPLAYAKPLYPPAYWPLSVFICITAPGRKAISSTTAMIQTKKTAPLFYQAFQAGVKSDLVVLKQALAAKDFLTLADVSEHSALSMHGLMLATQPALIYFAPATLAIIKAVKSWREAGLPVFCTIDAGAQVKVFTVPEEEAAVAKRLASLVTEGYIQELWTTTLGAGAEVIA